VSKKPPECTFCGGMHATIDEFNIGSDIDPEGEEVQHRRRCGCGAHVLFVDRVHFEEPKSNLGRIRYWGTWMFDKDGPTIEDMLGGF